MTLSSRTQVVEQGDPSGDQRAFRRCLGQFSTGVTVITTRWSGEPVGVTASSFSSVSLDPPLILWSIRRESRYFSAFAAAKHFTVNILSAEQIDLSQRFASPTENKFEGVDWKAGAGGSPILADVLAVLECDTEATHDGGDHLILIGRVRNFVQFSGTGLLYAQGRYAIAEDHPTLLVAPATEPNRMPDGQGTSLVEKMRFTALLGFVGMYASAAFDEFRRAEGVNLAQSRVLFTLRHRSEATLDQIVDLSYLTRPSAEDALAILTERGSVEERHGMFSLTSVGQETFEKLATQFDRFEAKLLADIPKQDLAASRGVLRILQARLKPV